MRRKKQTAPDGGSPEAEPSEQGQEIEINVSSEGEAAGGQPEAAAAEEKPSAEEVLQRQVAELEDKLLRMAAEFENFKKRTARQYEIMVRAANDDLIVELLEVVDNFERALNHAENNTDFEAFHQGTELILNQMMNLLKKYDVIPIDSIGQPFDPNLHEALMQIESDEYDEGVVAVEMVRGYRQGDRVVRHAKVGVSSGRKENDKSE